MVNSNVITINGQTIVNGSINFNGDLNITSNGDNVFINGELVHTRTSLL